MIISFIVANYLRLSSRGKAVPILDRTPSQRIISGSSTSSSDDQRYQAGGHKDFTSEVNARRHGRDVGIIFYTYVSDQYSPFCTKVINTTVREAIHVLDGLVYHETGLNIEEH